MSVKIGIQPFGARAIVPMTGTQDVAEETGGHVDTAFGASFSQNLLARKLGVTSFFQLRCLDLGEQEGTIIEAFFGFRKDEMTIQE